MTDYCKYADVFYGNGEVTSFSENGLASKWFYIKALCGNTTPHAVLPFGKISVGAYSGGYPTGYGTHCPNFSGEVKKFSDRLQIRGFSHLHQSGTGAIGYYYNYAVTTPFYGKISEIQKFHTAESENGKPGFYSVNFNNISASLTVSNDVAFHKYTFQNKNGRVAVDFSNDGLLKAFGKKYYSFPKNVCVKTDGKDTLFCKATLSGIPLYFCVKAYGKNVKTHLFSGKREQKASCLEFKRPVKSFGGVFDFEGDEIEIKLSYSTVSFEKAEKAVDSLKDNFEAAAENAYLIWNEYLSKIKIETGDEVLKNKFYSCFYHSLIKPAIMTDENILGVCGSAVCDIATFWDQYKTLMPLIFMLYKNEGKAIADAVINISRTLGRIPCSFGLTDMFPCEKQAKMLGIITLCEAYYAGLCDKRDIEECIKRELSLKDTLKFLKTGYFERYTHILDVTDACSYAADITDDEAFREKLLNIAGLWKNAYGKDGLMSEKSPYYEGDRYTYSFRLQSNPEERVKFAGGKEYFSMLLDGFFGFGKESVKQLTDPAKIKKTSYHRFEGFNNECDMESPWTYIFAGQHNKLCDIIGAAVGETYKTGRGGLPGNNDSGGLSSCFIWLCLGLFPWTGKGKMLLGCPQIDKAVIVLSNGKTLNIEVEKGKNQRRYVKEIYFNKNQINDYTVDLKEIYCGGTLKFVIE